MADHRSTAPDNTLGDGLLANHPRCSQGEPDYPGSAFHPPSSTKKHGRENRRALAAVTAEGAGGSSV